MDRGLKDAIERFTMQVTNALVDAADDTMLDANSLRDDVTLEAFNLCCAIVDADSRQTDDELWAIAATFGSAGLIPGGTSPSDLRQSSLVVGKVRWLLVPSALFRTLLDVDQTKGSDLAWTYLDEAMSVAYMVASLDQFPSTDELRAISSFQSMLRSHLGARPSAEAVRSAKANGNSRRRANNAAPGLTSKGLDVVRLDDADPDHSDLETADVNMSTLDAEEPGNTTPHHAEPEPIEDVLTELDKLIGLSSVKEEVRLLSSLLRVQKLRSERGLPTIDNTKHLVFSGNPGTGKTTVARLLARIYHSLGVVPKGQLVEVDRGGLVAGFVGQTASKVAEVFDRADGGVLLVDEAYSLVRGSDKDFGREAIDAIVKQVEDRRDSMVVILAGYPKEMASLIAANPGFQSRFPKTIVFPDYDNGELLAILNLISSANHYHLTADANNAAEAWFDANQRGYGFGNGRLARNLFEAAVAQHAGRLVTVECPTDEDLTTLEAADISNVPMPDGSHHIAGSETATENRHSSEPDPDLPDPGLPDAPLESR